VNVTSTAQGINNAGVIVGESRNSLGGSRAFVGLRPLAWSRCRVRVHSPMTSIEMVRLSADSTNLTGRVHAVDGAMA
jgi:hypothetical protein